jgi:hypothetical protein
MKSNLKLRAEIIRLRYRLELELWRKWYWTKASRYDRGLTNTVPVFDAYPDRNLVRMLSKAHRNSRRYAGRKVAA